MAGMTEKPESPSDIAILAVRVCSELQAYIEGIRALSKTPCGQTHTDILAGRASLCAEEWIDYFSGQVELIRKRGAAEGGRS